MKKASKKPWPTKDAMQQVYKNRLWGNDDTDFYSGEGSHHSETVGPYIKALTTFFNSLESPPMVCDLDCGDLNVGKALVAHIQTYKAVYILKVKGIWLQHYIRP